MRISNVNENHENAASLRGFTLVEVMVAVFAAAIVLIGLYASFTFGCSLVQLSRQNLRATEIILTRLERIRLFTFSQITDPTFNPTTFTEYFDPTDQGTGGGGAVYNGTFSATVPAVGTLPESYRTNMLLVTVSVSWTSGDNLRTRSGQTYVAKDGIEGYIAKGQ